jgi:hypothetical protein
MNPVMGLGGCDRKPVVAFVGQNYIIVNHPKFLIETCQKYKNMGNK